MKLHALICSALLAAAALSLSAPAAAAAKPAPDKLLKACTAPDGKDHDATIAACTEIIEAGKVKGKELADVYLARGAARGNIANATGNREGYAPAIEDFTQSIKLDPQLAIAYLNRGLAYLFIDEFEQAHPDFDRAIELKLKSPLAHFGRARCRAARGDYAGALKDADEAIRLEPKNAGWRVFSGAVRLQLADFAGAIEDFTKALTLSPVENQKVTALVGRARAYGRLDEDKKAIADLNEANILRPKNPTTLNDLCWRRAVWGRELDKAIADCNASIAIEPSELRYGSRAFLHLRRADPWAAIDDFTAALAIKPDYAFALYGRGVARLRVGQTAEGQADIVAGVSKDSNIANEFAKYGLTP